MAEKIGDLTTYKEKAKEGCDVLFRVTIKGESELLPGIPYHMSLKIFDSIKEANLKKLIEQVNSMGISEVPQTDGLRFRPVIFTSSFNGGKFYMLEIDGLDPKYKKFYEANSDRGRVYERFFHHITINKEMFDRINKEGLRPEEVSFGPLILEEGAGNTFHTFDTPLQKSEINYPLIKETIFLNFDLKTKHKKALSMPNEILGNYLEDNPELISSLMRKHRQRLEHHFGKDADSIELAHLSGISTVYKVKSR